jgi:hypothetical protein
MFSANFEQRTRSIQLLPPPLLLLLLLHGAGL